MARVAVVGAGISGLSTAYFLQQAGHDVVVLEAAARPGGKMQTLAVGDRLIDEGPNGWLDSEPAMQGLLTALGLDDEIRPASDERNTRWIFADEQLHEVPMSPPKLLASKLIPWRAKLRMVLDLVMPRGRDGESIASFVRRRLGSWFVRRMVGPMVAGIYAGRPEQLELKAAFPKMVQLEAEHRSLFLAMMARRRGGAPAGHLQTLRGGAARLVQRLVEVLDDVRLSTPVKGLSRSQEGWNLELEEGGLTAEAVVLATPAPVMAKLIAPFAPESAEGLREIPYAPVVVVGTSAPVGSWERPAEGFGVLKASDQDLEGALGILFTHCSYPEQAGEGEVLLRTVMGGAVHPEVGTWNEQQILAAARRAHERVLGPMKNPPTAEVVIRHPKGIPQYTLGHSERVALARRVEHLPGIVLVGNHLEGIGVKDCVRQAREAADKLQPWLQAK